jgi:hypothetical protein
MSFFNVNYIPKFKYTFSNEKVASITSIEEKISLNSSDGCIVTATISLESNSAEDSIIDIKLEKNNQAVTDCVWSIFLPQYPITTTVHFTDLTQHKNTDTYKISVSKPDCCKKFKATFLNI